ncbi:uncharacterized protein LOC135472581 [Liolophura sinensis]|uniref:uncharacterized protein LOC135472581 n=1 Tax=Liolophura sinensis TaxID=3198878 RepID=UPI00315843F1
MLMSQGVSKELAIMALKASNNRVVAAEAWLFQQNEEQTTESPVVESSSEGEMSGTCMPQASTDGGLPASVSCHPPGFCPDQEAMSALLELGLPREKVVKALEATNNNVEEASEWIIQNTAELKAAVENLLKVNQTTTATNAQENITEAKNLITDAGVANKSNNTASPPELPTSQGTICENGRHVPKEDSYPLTPGGDQHGDGEDSEDDMPSLEDDDDEEIPELEYDTDDGLSNDSNSVSTESDTQRISIFVGNFPYGTTQVELLEIFSEYEPTKITMINNSDQYRTTYAFLVLPTMELAEAAIEEMSGEYYNGRALLVGMAFIDRGYNEPPDEEDPNTEENDDGENESSTSGLSESVQLFDSLMKTLWPDCRLLEHGIYGRLDINVTSVVDDHFFYGHVTDFGKEMLLLSALNEELNQVCHRMLPEKRIPMHRCAALFEGNWYRAYNMGQCGQGKQQAVLFVDYGNIESLPARELRRPDPRFWEAPAVAKLFRLVVGSLADHPNIEGSTIKIATIPKKDCEEMNSITHVKIIDFL